MSKKDTHTIYNLVDGSTSMLSDVHLAAWLNGGEVWLVCELCEKETDILQEAVCCGHGTNRKTFLVCPECHSMANDANETDREE